MQNVERLLFPDSYKIKKHYCKYEGGLTHYTFQIVDAELDPFDVEISYSQIQIDTKDYTHICLEGWHIDFLGRAYNQFHKEIKENER